MPNADRPQAKPRAQITVAGRRARHEPKETRRAPPEPRDGNLAANFFPIVYATDDDGEVFSADADVTIRFSVPGAFAVECERCGRAPCACGAMLRRARREGLGA